MLCGNDCLKKKVIGMSKMVGRGVLWAIGLASVTIASAARAQEADDATTTRDAGEAKSAEPGDGRERVQLSLQGSMIDYLKETVKPDQSPGSTVEPQESEASTTTYGLAGSGTGIGVGVTTGQWLIGARVQFASTTFSRAGGSEDQALSIAFVPRAEVMFGSGAGRPYFAGLVSVEHASTTSKTTVTSNNSAATATFTNEDSSTRYGIGAAFGVHAFVNRSLSIDPEISVLPAWGSGTMKSAGSAGSTVSTDYSLNTLRVLLTVGLSGWIDTGGAPPAPPPREEPSEASTSAAAAVIAEPEATPISVDIHLPNHRKLYLQVLKDPAQPFVLVRLNEPRNSFTLLKCDDVSVVTSNETIKLSIRTHGEHYLTGRLPIHGAQVLAGIVDSSVVVCGEQWPLGQESREQIQGFLKARRETIEDRGGSVPETEVEPTEAPADAAPAPEAAPSPPPPAPAGASPAKAPPVAPSAGSTAKAPAAPTSASTPKALPAPSAGATPKAPATPSAPPPAPGR